MPIPGEYASYGVNQEIDERNFAGRRTNERPEAVRLHVQSGVHSPVRWRVLGPVANFPEFYAAFGCTAPATDGPPIW